MKKKEGEQIAQKKIYDTKMWKIFQFGCDKIFFLFYTRMASMIHTNVFRVEKSKIFSVFRREGMGVQFEIEKNL